jgi:hypothetical protein
MIARGQFGGLSGLFKEDWIRMLQVLSGLEEGQLLDEGCLLPGGKLPMNHNITRFRR